MKHQLPIITITEDHQSIDIKEIIQYTDCMQQNSGDLIFVTSTWPGREDVAI